MSIAARPLTYNAYHNPVSYEEPGRPLNLPSQQPSPGGADGSNELGITRTGAHANNNHLYPEQQQPAFPALHLFSLNNTFAPKHILLGPPTVTPTSRLKIGRQTSQKTAPHPSNTYFDSKVLSRTHAELWAENGKIYIRDLRSSNGTFINGNRLSPEGCESEPNEIKNEDLIEFGIDIVAEDGQQILHHKVAARAFTILDAHAADRAQHDWTNLYRTATLGVGMAHDGQGGAGGAGAGGAGGGAGSNVGVGPGGSIMGPGAEGGLRRGKGGKSFDHVIAQLQAEMSRLSAAGIGSPEATAARAAAAAKRQRAKNANASGGGEKGQGADGAPLSPLEETAQRLSLLLSSLSITRSQLDAIRAASAEANQATESATSETPEEGQSTVTPSTPADEPGEDEANLSTLKLLSKPSPEDASATHPPSAAKDAPATGDSAPAANAPIPAAAIAAASRLPALRDSLSTLRYNVRDVRAMLLTTLRERELRESDEQLALASLRNGNGNAGPSSGGPRRLDLGSGLSMGILEPNGSGGGSGSSFGLNLGGGIPGLPSSSCFPATSAPMVASTSQVLPGFGGLLGSPPKEPLPRLPLGEGESGNEGMSQTQMMFMRRSKMRAHDLYMTSSRSSELDGDGNGGGFGAPPPLEPDRKTRAPPLPPNAFAFDSDDAMLDRLEDKAGGDADGDLSTGRGGSQGLFGDLFPDRPGTSGRKRSADEHFEEEDAAAAEEAASLHRAEDASADTRGEAMERMPEGLSVSVQGSGTAPSGSPDPFLDRAGPANGDGPGQDAHDANSALVSAPATITTARLDRAEAALQELRGMLAQVEKRRGRFGSVGARRNASSAPAPADLVARLDRLERSILVKRDLNADSAAPVAKAGVGAEAEHADSAQEGLAALRTRWLGSSDAIPSGPGGGANGSGSGEGARKTKAELVWDGLQNKYAGRATADDLGAPAPIAKT